MALCWRLGSRDAEVAAEQGEGEVTDLTATLKIDSRKFSVENWHRLVV